MSRSGIPDHHQAYTGRTMPSQHVPRSGYSSEETVFCPRNDVPASTSHLHQPTRDPLHVLQMKHRQDKQMRQSRQDQTSHHQQPLHPGDFSQSWNQGATRPDQGSTSAPRLVDQQTYTTVGDFMQHLEKFMGTQGMVHPIDTDHPAKLDTPKPQRPTPSGVSGNGGVPCEHEPHWKRIRSKRGFSYFVCFVCGDKWRTRSLNSTHSVPCNAVTEQSCDSAAPRKDHGELSACSPEHDNEEHTLPSHQAEYATNRQTDGDRAPSAPVEFPTSLTGWPSSTDASLLTQLPCSMAIPGLNSNLNLAAQKFGPVPPSPKNLCGASPRIQLTGTTGQLHHLHRQHAPLMADSQLAESSIPYSHSAPAVPGPDGSLLIHQANAGLLGAQPTTLTDSRLRPSTTGSVGDQHQALAAFLRSPSCASSMASRSYSVGHSDTTDPFGTPFGRRSVSSMLSMPHSHSSLATSTEVLRQLFVEGQQPATGTVDAFRHQRDPAYLGSGTTVASEPVVRQPVGSAETVDGTQTTGSASQLESQDLLDSITKYLASQREDAFGNE